MNILQIIDSAVSDNSVAGKAAKKRKLMKGKKNDFTNKLYGTSGKGKGSPMTNVFKN